MAGEDRGYNFLCQIRTLQQRHHLGPGGAARVIRDWGRHGWVPSCGVCATLRPPPGCRRCIPSRRQRYPRFALETGKAVPHPPACELPVGGLILWQNTLWLLDWKGMGRRGLSRKMSWNQVQRALGFCAAGGEGKEAQRHSEKEAVKLCVTMGLRCDVIVGRPLRIWVKLEISEASHASRRSSVLNAKAGGG